MASKSSRRSTSLSLGRVVGWCALFVLVLAGVIFLLQGINKLFDDKEIFTKDFLSILSRIEYYASVIALGLAAFYYVDSYVKEKNRTIWFIVVVVLIILAFLGYVAI
jgi:Ca2+/Na+ antiporter